MLRSASMLSTMLLSACATTAPVPSGNDVEDAVVSDVVADHSVSRDAPDIASCNPIIRDLSVDWDERDYWCEGGRLMVRQTVLLASLEKARRQLAALRESAESIERNARRAVARIDSRLARDMEEAPAKIVPAPVAVTSDESDSARIIFARGREVLGPRGRRAVAALARRVAPGSQVTLRGHLIHGEFPLIDPLDAERRSVGRSLSVREAWRDAGVDVSTVTILHHSGGFSGAYVEVIFDD